MAKAKENLLNQGLYKGRYEIGVYKLCRKAGDVDELVDIFDTPMEFAKFLKVSLDRAYTILNNHTKRKDKNILVNGVFHELALIDMR